MVLQIKGELNLIWPELQYYIQACIVETELDLGGRIWQVTVSNSVEYWELLVRVPQAPLTVHQKTDISEIECKINLGWGCFEFLDSNILACIEEPEAGLCMALFIRYYYNSKTRTCEEFVYGGCGGNNNRFETLEECQNYCMTWSYKPAVWIFTTVYSLLK